MHRSLSRLCAAAALTCASAVAMAVPPPSAGATFQWQLTGTFDGNIAAQVYDLDLFDTPASRVATLERRGAQSICYISVGTVENWRPDAARFPAQVIGRPYAGWPGERWLDIRRIDLIGPVLEARLDTCRAKGFAGVEPDNVDGYENTTGFPLTEADQETFLRWLADAAHARGLSIGLKNVPGLAERLQPVFDWALTEDCYVDGWCGDLAPFIANGKAVFVTEYADTDVNFDEACAVLAPEKFTPIYKNRGLDAFRRTCGDGANASTSVTRRVPAMTQPAIPVRGFARHTP